MGASSDAGRVVQGGPRGDTHARYRVMVVDDSALIRGLITRTLESDPDIKVVESVGNGELAVKAVGRVDVDVVILDIEMPVMDGLTALPEILRAAPGVKIIMASTLTRRNALVSIRALAAGACDYVAKPASVRELHAPDGFRQELLAKVKALADPSRRRSRSADAAAPKRPSLGLYGSAKIALRPPSPRRPELIAIGSSTGGPQALFNILAELRSQLRVPILITQHMPPTFTTILAEHIERVYESRCAEARDKEPLVPGRIYLAPGDYHMIVERGGGAPEIRIVQGPPENFCRPAVDPMLRSLAAVFGPRVLGVILTGMGRDGLIGSQAIVEAGGTIIAQDEATSVVWGMPGAVATAGLCSSVSPIDAVAGRVLTLVNGSGK